MIKVIIVDDEPLVRIGLKSLIQWEANGLSIEGEASNGKEAIELFNTCKPDIVVTDIKMPIMDGIELIKEASGMKNRTQFIVLSCFSDFEYVKEAMRLGAADYLIKSDIKPKQLLEVLSKVKSKIEEHRIVSEKENVINDSINKSIALLKESFIKDLISGSLKDDIEIQEKINFFKIRLFAVNLILMKIKLNDFDDIRKIYNDKNEKMLRITVINITEEIIPVRYNREVIADKSDEYILLLNLVESDGTDYKDEINKLHRNLIKTIKDYLNISISIGISIPFNGFRNMGRAYDEATKAVDARFFKGKDCVIFAENLERETSYQITYDLCQNSEKAIGSYAEAMNSVGCINKVNELFNDLSKGITDENSIRKLYLRIIEVVIASIPKRPSSMNSGKTPYEEILALETFSEINKYTVEFITRYFKNAYEEEFIDNKSYVEQAINIVKKYYHEDISLHSVAEKININPSYLSRVFKQETGENFISYVTKLRIDKAKYLLETKKFKVYEVAEKVGYQNYTYFSKIFKKIAGLNPEEFK